MFVRAIRNLLHRIVRKMETAMGVENDLLHFIIDTSLGAFVDLMLSMRLASRREALPADARNVARLLTTQATDCGACVQFNVNLALKEGMRPEWIEATIQQKLEALPPELQEIYEFTGHVLRNTYEEDALRESIRERYGDRALIDLAYAIAGAQVMPMTKRALGFAKTCSKVEVRVGEARAHAGALSTSVAT